MKLDKRKMLRNLDIVAGKLRCKPHAFLSIEGEPDFNAAEVRLNRLGKCLECFIFLFEMCNDGDELNEMEEAHHKEFIRYLKECDNAFDIGKGPEK